MLTNLAPSLGSRHDDKQNQQTNEEADQPNSLVTEPESSTSLTPEPATGHDPEPHNLLPLRLF
jgi:hypothetical protein